MKPLAEFSPCHTYRYVLRRSLSRPPEAGTCLFLMLNPSTADAINNDPTIRRCIGFADEWGFGTLVVCNLFALRSTDPKVLKQSAGPVGPDNDQHILREAKEAKLVVCAWGVHGSLQHRGVTVKRMLAQAGVKLHCLAVTRFRHPKHPLYIKGGTKPSPWLVGGAA